MIVHATWNYNRMCDRQNNELPQNVHILISGTCVCITLYAKGTLQMWLRYGLIEGIVLYYPNRLSVITNVLQSQRRRCDSAIIVPWLLSLKTKGEPMNQGLQIASRTSRRQGNRFFPGVSGRNIILPIT